MFLNQQLRAPSDIGALGISLRFRKGVGKVDLEDDIESKENNCYGWLAAAQDLIRDRIPPIFVLLKFPSMPFFS